LPDLPKLTANRQSNSGETLNGPEREADLDDAWLEDLVEVPGMKSKVKKKKEDGGKVPKKKGKRKK